MGQKLAASLNRLIDEQSSEEMPRAEIIGLLATAADIEPVDVNQILQGDTSPPPETLRAFADVLEDSSFIEKSHQVPIKEVIPKEQYERLQRIKADLERALDL
jgi:hypothetical protein